jgi:hypothetical protein
VNLGVVVAVERRRRRPARAASTSGEETDGVESGGEETGGDFEFWDESETAQGGLLFIGSKISTSVLS